MLCHADSLGILPVQWCLKNGVNLTPPKGLYPVEVCGVGIIQASVSLSSKWCHHVYMENLQCGLTVMEAKRSSLAWLILVSPIAPLLEKYGVGFSASMAGHFLCQLLYSCFSVMLCRERSEQQWCPDMKVSEKSFYLYDKMTVVYFFQLSVLSTLLWYS